MFKFILAQLLERELMQLEILELKHNVDHSALKQAVLDQMHNLRAHNRLQIKSHSFKHLEGYFNCFIDVDSKGIYANLYSDEPIKMLTPPHFKKCFLLISSADSFTIHRFL